MAKNIFNTVQGSNPSSNYFDLSHDLKFSLNMGSLIPTLVMDIVPGDSINISSESMLRFAALIAPIMHRVKVTHHYFFVPNRIIWEGWEQWITGNEDTEPPYLLPHLTGPIRMNQVGSLADYMGIPTFESDETPAYVPKINALPFAAVAKIYYEYYRDQNNYTPSQQTDIEEWSILTDGDNSDNGTTMPMNQFFFTKQNFLRAWEHDYFTSALPFAQKGEDVMLPLGDFNDVDVFYSNPGVPYTGAGAFSKIDGTVYDPGSEYNIRVGATGSMESSQGGNPKLAYDPNGTLLAETSALEAGAASVNNLRRAFRLQEWLEKNARGGTRYVESMLVHFGVRSSDARLQRPEYLGGSVQNMVISEVLSTTQTLDPSSGDVVNPVGQMSGHGISVGGSRRIRYYAEEHGWIIGLISIMPQTAYQQGIPKKFSRFDRYEYFWPSFAHIGEQAIANQEVYLNLEEVEADNLGTFGYIPRYAEYRFENSRVAGQFRDTLDFWHLGRKFENQPQLNQAFIYPSVNEFDRIFAVDSTVADTIYAHILNRVKARRKMPKYGTPFM